MKTHLKVLLLGVLFLTTGLAVAQEPDSLIIMSLVSPPGDTATTSVFLHNTQFPVSGFEMRIVLQDSLYTSFQGAEPGDEVADFEHFFVAFSQGTCRIVGIADLTGDGPPPLPIGYHEIARLFILVDENAPWGGSDSLIFWDDSLPPYRDNSISDSTGYINLVPTLVGGILFFETPIGVDDGASGLPVKMELSQNYPNPFNAQTSISFFLPTDVDDVSLSIFDLLGRELKRFAFGELSAGKHTVVWNGTDESGRPVGSGIYFYRLSSPASAAVTMRMTLLK